MDIPKYKLRYEAKIPTVRRGEQCIAFSLLFKDLSSVRKSWIIAELLHNSSLFKKEITWSKKYYFCQTKLFFFFLPFSRPRLNFITTLIMFLLVCTWRHKWVAPKIPCGRVTYIISHTLSLLCNQTLCVLVMYFYEMYF